MNAWMNDAGNLGTPKYEDAIAQITAGTTYDNVENVGQVIDRMSSYSASLNIGYLASVTAAKQVTLGVNIYSCDQSDGVFDAAVNLLTATAMLSGALSASAGVYQLPINLEPYKRYIKLGKTFDLTATGTDTLTITQSQLWLTGSKYKPASQNA